MKHTLPALLCLSFFACPTTMQNDAGPSCDGCLQTQTCVTAIASAVSPLACGLGGVACAVCTTDQQCSNGQCVARPVVDAGTDAGIADAGVEDAGSPDAGAPDAGQAIPLPAVPLHTQSRWIVDSNNARIKLASVNWYGAEELDHAVAGLERAHRSDIAKLVRSMGFNAVRIPFSLEMYERNPLVRDAVLARNTDLKGKTALEVLDAVIAALAHEGLMVILDNHVSAAGWCCSDSDGEGLWYTAAYPETKWLESLRGIAARYLAQPAVIGIDLRNELRPVLEPGCTTCTSCPCASCDCKTPTWGGDAGTDWGAAATRAGNAVLLANSNLLIFVGGTNYSTDFSGPYTNPIALNVPNRVVYSPHDYQWYHQGTSSYAQLKTELGNSWGYLVTQNQPYTAPIWVGEFGTCNSDPNCIGGTGGQGVWFENFRRYLAEADLDWSYWPLNGTQANAPTRTFGDADGFGVLNPAWNGPASTDLQSALQALQPATQGP